MQLHKRNDWEPNLTIREDKIVVWRRITRALKDIYEHNKDFVIKDTQNIVHSTGNVETSTLVWPLVPWT